MSSDPTPPVVALPRHRYTVNTRGRWADVLCIACTWHIRGVSPEFAHELGRRHQQEPSVPPDIPGAPAWATMPTPRILEELG
jgi:hypothetical protein